MLLAWRILALSGPGLSRVQLRGRPNSRQAATPGSLAEAMGRPHFLSRIRTGAFTTCRAKRAQHTCVAR